MNQLDQIISFKRQVLETRKLLVREDELASSEFFSRPVLSLKKSLSANNNNGIIAEFKRRSPSKGFINKDADVTAVTNDYKSFGAAGLSILTDNHFFAGNTEDLVLARANPMPILRKDFIIDSYQVTASRAMGADVILLIAACLSVAEVKELANYAHELGMEVLLEIHDERELGHINDMIDIVGINNRNLKTFEVDINHSIALSRLLPAGIMKIAESGIDHIDTIKRFKDVGYNGFLIGELFMRSSDPGLAFKNFAAALNAS